MTNEELVQLYQHGDKQALSKLIEQNTGIVYKLANKFYVEDTNSIDKEDLEQEGFIGLMIAAEKYDFNNPKKAKFTTYAVHWIYSKINRYITQKNTNEETSLNTPIGKDEDAEIMDTLKSADYSFENVEERIYNQQLRKELEEVIMEHNTLKEREILKLRYGWNGNKSMTLYEVGQVFGTTLEKVRYTENTALRKIRRSPWGAIKAKEIYTRKIEEAKYSIDKVIDKINFADRYLSI
ncbi:sigma-70 family RNA polymerase sigma factor [Clostridium lundense]|uniref:sigma-70 family RNA polymerase sigma factor n=1 Tax=Clostridium lundense TaxID=319475 RepID=UPI0004847C4A|nr:sigma-70 family RNA polymerase sigma factor [Clostridium lundense]